jgi:hypothetical protein
MPLRGSVGGNSSLPAPRSNPRPALPPCLRSSARLRRSEHAPRRCSPHPSPRPRARSRCAGLPPRRALRGAPAQVTDGVDEHALLAPPLPLTRASPRRARARDVRPSQVLKGHLFLSAVARLLPPPLADMGAYAHVPSHPGLEPPPSHAPPHPAIARAARAEAARACRLEPFEPLRARAGWEGSGAQRHAHRGTG